MHIDHIINQNYRDLETDAATAQWDVRPGSLLECSRQDVLTRSVDAWNLVDHSKNVDGWRHNGITNPLDGTDDQLGSQVLSLWRELDMDAIRCQLIEDVEDAVKAGEIENFWQYPELLQKYDDHPPLVDCMGSVSTYVYDESGAHEDMCSGELFGDDIAEDDIAEDALEHTIDQETKAFEENVGALQAENVGALQAASGSAPTKSEKRLAALEAGFKRLAVIKETSVVSPAAPFTGALQAGPDGVKADALPACATSSLADSSDKPPVDADPEIIRRAEVVDALMKSAALMRGVGEERLAACMDSQVSRNLREARSARSKIGQVLRGESI
jgi:hypothetical protein